MGYKGSATTEKAVNKVMHSQLFGMRQKCGD